MNQKNTSSNPTQWFLACVRRGAYKNKACHKAPCGVQINLQRDGMKVVHKCTSFLQNGQKKDRKVTNTTMTELL